jgi:hypothetical protein
MLASANNISNNPNVIGALIRCESCGAISAVSAPTAIFTTKCKSCVMQNYLDLESLMQSPQPIPAHSGRQQQQDSAVTTTTTTNASFKTPTKSLNPLTDKKLLSELEIDWNLPNEHAQWEKFMEQYPQYTGYKSIFSQVRAYQQMLQHFGSQFNIGVPLQNSSNKQYRTYVQCKHCHFKSEEKPCYKFIQHSYQCPRCKTPTRKRFRSAETEQQEESHGEIEEIEEKEAEQQHETMRNNNVEGNNEGSSAKRNKGDVHGANGQWYSVPAYIRLNEEKLSRLYAEKFRVVSVHRAKLGRRFHGTLECVSCGATATHPVYKLLTNPIQCQSCDISTAATVLESNENTKNDENQQSSISSSAAATESNAAIPTTTVIDNPLAHFSHAVATILASSPPFGSV